MFSKRSVKPRKAVAAEEEAVVVRAPAPDAPARVPVQEVGAERLREQDL